MKIKPLSNRILIQQVEAEDKTAGGIYIPDTSKEKPAQGVVVALGLGQQLENGQPFKFTVAVGDTVLYGKYAGTEIESEGIKYIMMREADAVAIVTL